MALASAACRGRTVCSPGSCGPEPSVQGAPAQQTAGRHRGSPGISQPCDPCRAGRQRLLAVSQGWAGRGGRSWVRAVSGKGPEPSPTLPCCCSLQLTEEHTRVANYLRQALQYLRSPQESMREVAIRFIGEPGLPPRVRAAQPQPYQLPWQRHLGPVPQSPGFPRGCCCPLEAVPLGLSMWQGPRLSPADPGGRGATGLAAPHEGSCATGAVTGSVFAGLAGRTVRRHPQDLQVLCRGE